jgi:hypothetical protein
LKLGVRLYGQKLANDANTAMPSMASIRKVMKPQ